MLGFFGSRFGLEKFKTDGLRDEAEKIYHAALIDDETPPSRSFPLQMEEDHLIYARGRGVLIWAAMMVLLTVVHDWQGTLTQVGWFFSKAALVTFGGDYAVCGVD